MWSRTSDTGFLHTHKMMQILDGMFWKGHLVRQSMMVHVQPIKLLGGY